MSAYPCTKESKHPQTKYWPECLPPNENRLFIIERSKNANLVIYDANINKDGVLDPDRPIDVYWLSYAESKNPPKEDLNFLEKMKAYGYNSSPLKGEPGAFEVSLVAIGDRKGKLYLDENKKPVALLPLKGKMAKPTKIYVYSTERFGFLPKVHYVEIFGIDPTTGEEVYEKQEF